MNVRKVLVTGGAGYIGSHACVALSEAGYVPVIYDMACDRKMVAGINAITRRSVEVAEDDCRNIMALDHTFRTQGPFWGVLHFAAYKWVGASCRIPIEYYDNNVGSLAKVLAAMQKNDVKRLVFSSSCTVYGEPDELPVTETTPMGRATSPYGRTKQVCEQLIDDVVSSGSGLHAVTLRYFNPVGAHPSGLIGEMPVGKPETLVPYITQVAAGIRSSLTVFGSDYPTRDGTCVRDYLHVVDLARAHVDALTWIDHQRWNGRDTEGYNERFNLGMGRGVSVLEAITAFEEATGQKLRYTLGPRRPGDVVEVYASVNKAKRELGWQAKLSMVDAMQGAWRWQQNFPPDGVMRHPAWSQVPPGHCPVCKARPGEPCDAGLHS